MNNYHCHTYRCGHGYGSEEDMVKAAIALGIEELGFSEHVPLPHYRLFLLKSLPHSLTSLHSLLSWGKAFILNGPGMRMPYKKRKEHQKVVQDLKIKYKAQITIYQGYECEYFKEYLDYYQRLLDTQEVDYLILGNHFDQYPIYSHYYGKKKVSDQMLKHYQHDVIAAIHTQLFSYIAHPDLFMTGRNEFDSLCLEVSTSICKEAKKYDIPLEVNAGGIRKGLVNKNDEMVYPYNNDHFFHISQEIDNKIILGIDAHHPDHFNEKDIALLNKFVEKHHLKTIKQLTFKKGNTH